MKIILEKSRQASAFSVEESFFQDELTRAAEIIKERVAGIPKYREEKNADFHHVHGTIGIFGERGLGKTSFLLSLKKLLNPGNESKIPDSKIDTGELAKSLHFLPILDPTLLEETEYFLITLISAICHEVQEKRRSGSEKFKGSYSDWEKSLRGLADHLIAVEGLGYEKTLRELAGSPEIFAQEALIKGHSGRQLSEAFHEFGSASIAYLRNFQTGLKALVILLDDIDTAFGKGWPVLETIRKYLTTPELIVLVSGDFELFRLVVHMEHTKRVKANDLKNERIYDSVIRDTEKQYLEKLLQPKSRIHLPNPRDKIFGNEIIIKETNNSNNEYQLSDLFTKFCEDLFWTEDHRHLKPFQHWNQAREIIPSTSREIIGFIDGVLREYIQEETNKGPGKDLLIDRLIDFTMPLLYDCGIDPRDLKKAISRDGEYRLFRFLTFLTDGTKSIEYWQKGYHLAPNFSNIEQNRVILAIQAGFNRAYRLAPLRISDYWLKVAATWINASENVSEDDGLDTYLSYLKFDTSEEPPDMYAWDICYRYQKKGIDNIDSIGPGFCIVDESEGIDELGTEGRFIYDLCSFYIETGRRSLRHISFIYGLAWLNELLGKPLYNPKEPPASETTDDKTDRDAINKSIIAGLLGLAIQVRHYPAYMPGQPILWEKAKTSYRTITAEDIKMIQPWPGRISKWKDLYEKIEHNLAVPQLSYIWNRFHHDLYKQKSDLEKSGGMNAGEIMRLSALAFLNAILLEESRLRGYSDVITFHHMGGNSEILFTNLDLIKEKDESSEAVQKKDGSGIDEKIKSNLSKCYLFRTWAMCPLIWSIVTPDDQDRLMEILRKLCSPGSPFTSFLDELDELKLNKSEIRSAYGDLSSLKTDTIESNESAEKSETSSISVDRGRVIHVQADSIIIEGLKHTGVGDKYVVPETDKDKA